MPFIDSSQSIRSHLHLSDVSTPMLVGICALCLVALLLAAGNLIALFEGQGQVVVRKGDAGNALSSSSADASSSMPGALDQPASLPASSAEAQAQLPSAKGSSQPASIYVFVSGAVSSPGVYQLASGARVVDAIDAAGGFSERAATDAVNQARTLQDGEQVDIPTAQEVEEGWAAGPQDAAPAISEAQGDGQAGPTGQLVNINTATESELEGLPGVGPATASKIVASRQQEGAFAAKEDLMRVSGIGEKKFAALQDLICV